MQKGKLGNQGLVASRIGLGCMGMSEFYGQSDDAQSIKTLERSLEIGVDFWDTADIYGPFTNEPLLSKVLKTKRKEVTLATKFGIVRSSTDPTVRGFDGSPAYCKKSCEASLQRLGVETIDLYYLHRVDTKVPIQETVGAMADLIKEGKVRYIGLSEASAETIRKAHGEHPISAVQTEYSLWSRDCEELIIPTCKELGIGFVPYSPLSRGFLSGEITKFEDFAPNDFRRISPRFQGENFNKNLAIVDALKEMALQKGVTASQLALAWVLAKGEGMFPIPGTRRIKYLEENAKAIDVKFSNEELAMIEEISPKSAIQGERYGEFGMKVVNL